MSGQESKVEDCEHEDFAAFVDVARITDEEGTAIIGYMAEVKVECRHCGEPFVFHGSNLPIGNLPGTPTLTADRTTLNAPCRPQSSDPSFGLGLLGFTMRATQQDGRSAN